MATDAAKANAEELRVVMSVIQILVGVDVNPLRSIVLVSKVVTRSCFKDIY
jgi:hypothetical protein